MELAVLFDSCRKCSENVKKAAILTGISENAVSLRSTVTVTSFAGYCRMRTAFSSLHYAAAFFSL